MLLAKNRKALRSYEIVDKYVAGVVLKGYEVKAIREGKVSFEGAYIDIKGNEAYIVNLNIGRYSKQSQKTDEIEAKKDRKLLLLKKEILELKKHIGQKGKTAVPLAFITSKSMVKLELATVKGRKEFEIKQVEKERQIKRDLQREQRNYD